MSIKRLEGYPESHASERLQIEAKEIFTQTSPSEPIPMCLLNLGPEGLNLITRTAVQKVLLSKNANGKNHYTFVGPGWVTESIYDGRMASSSEYDYFSQEEVIDAYVHNSVMAFKIKGFV
jgi:hypothetical protein